MPILDLVPPEAILPYSVLLQLVSVSYCKFEFHGVCEAMQHHRASCDWISRPKKIPRFIAEAEAGHALPEIDKALPK